MANRIRCCLLACLVWIALSESAGAACPAGSTIKEWLPAGELCLAAATYEKQAGSSPTLIVLLHGDASSGGPADYLFEYAERLAQPGVVLVALLRPGFSDKAGRTSEGNHHGRADSYTPANIAAVASAIEALKKHVQPKRTLIVAHSGGSAIAGVLIGKHPGLVQAAVLTSCPCDIVRWRKERGSAWLRSESPSSYTGKVPTATTVIAITGTNDDNTKPSLAQDYVAQLAKRGVPAMFEPVTGAGHSFNKDMQAAVTSAVKKILEQ
jgi:pimeloyl-ACP methyl ester carboxylesterase